MKQKVNDFLTTLLGCIWFGTILVGSMAMFLWLCKCFFGLVGVI